MATASNPVNVHSGSHVGLLATALMVMALIALLVLTVIGILFYMDYSSDQAAKKNGANIQIQAPEGSAVEQGAGAGGAGTGAGTGSSSRSGSGSAGTGAAGGAGGAGGNAAPADNSTIRITVPNVNLPNIGQ